MSTINGKACVVNGTPVDKVFSDGEQIYGRNIVLSTANFDRFWAFPSQSTIVDGYDGHKAVKADVTSWLADVRQPIYNADVQLIEPGEWYTMSFYAKGTGTFRTHIFPNVVDAGSGEYADGVFRTWATSDGYHEWTLTDDYVRHSWSFKTPTTLSPTKNEGNIMFRSVAPASTFASLPKIEKGISATPWSPAPEDVV